MLLDCNTNRLIYTVVSPLGPQEPGILFLSSEDKHQILFYGSHLRNGFGSHLRKKIRIRPLLWSITTARKLITYFILQNIRYSILEGSQALVF